MGCKELQITDYFRLTPTMESQESYTGVSVGTYKTPYSRFFPVVSVSTPNYRYYSPELGRWMSRDPITEDGGYNLYSFVYNNSGYWWDYLGLVPIDFTWNTEDVSQGVKDHPWSFKKIIRQHPNGQPKYIAGQAHSVFTVECACNIDCDMDDCKKISCKVLVNSTIEINPLNILLIKDEAKKKKVIGKTYGHEQLHILNDRNFAKDSDALKDLEGERFKCMKPLPCELKATELSVSYTLKLNREVDKKTRGYWPDDPGHFDKNHKDWKKGDPVSPKPGGDYDPIGNSLPEPLGGKWPKDPVIKKETEIKLEIY